MPQVLCDNGIYRLLCLMEWEERERGSSGPCFPSWFHPLGKPLVTACVSLKAQRGHPPLAIWQKQQGTSPAWRWHTGGSYDPYNPACADEHAVGVHPWPAVLLHTHMGLAHSNKSHWNHCKVLLTQNFTRKKAFWGPFPNSSFKPPFFSGNLS